MNNKINSTVQKYDMISKGDRVLAAVSGGADSMLLLNYLLSVKDIYDITVCAAHIEHGIRGQESIDDARFVELFCKDNGVEFHQLTIDAVNEAREIKTGVEEYSRKRRYEFFNSISCDKIATAHNLDDNVETVVFRLIRGTGLKGVCGIAPKNGKIIRPLIEISSSDIRKYCENNNLQYRIDSTNKSNDYTRNYIRNILLPGFEHINTDYANAINAFISDANEDMDFLSNTADKLYENSLTDGMLDKNQLAGCDVSIIKRVLLKYFSQYDIILSRLHLNEVLNLVYRKGKVQLYGDLFAAADDNYLRLADFGSNGNNISFVSKVLKISEFDSKGIDFYCDYDKIIGRAEIRSRIAGDAIRPANRGCKKSLKKLFNELRIPPEKRESIGVIADDAGVIGVIGYCVDERVKVDFGTKNILSVKTSSED